ncbi:T-cell surface glycoprotein CD3 epsilon chain [Salarias fasciatus]|uniref:CD3 gamma/delta subunit Ig-like domain-containing protein n=1 Tax=Salarias fasciatus TaxID=181472 RepID=A0A672IKN7_SALFA|nr:T-cell surface glycoprotein CD3 epsilon chain [Salarias fasciatus]
MDVHAVFIIFIMLPAAVKTAEGVKFWRDNVTLTCPEVGRWFENDKPIPNAETDDTYKFTYMDKGKYHCEYSGKKYQFYVEGRACKNCFELDGTVFLVVIIADVAATVVVMMMVFKCTKRKDSAGPTKTSRGPGNSGGRAPAVPSPDYEMLNPNTRSADTYSAVNRMG